MMDKILNYVNTALLIGLVFIGVSLINTKSLTGTTSTDTVTNFTELRATNIDVDTALSVGGVDETWTTGSCADATTTVIAVANPWGATAYVDKFIIYVNGAATSTWTMDVGTSSTAYAAPSEALIDDTGFATSTTGRIANTSGTASATYGFTDPGANSQDLIVLGSADYIVGTVSSVYTGAFTESTNTFTCTYKIHSFK
jgi:hypothetical protein